MSQENVDLVRSLRGISSGDIGCPSAEVCDPTDQRVSKGRLESGVDG